MTKIYPTIRRVVAAAVSGVINFRATVNAGIQVTVQYIIKTGDVIVPGIGVSLRPSTLSIDNKPGVLTSLLGATVVVDKPQAKPALQLSTIGTESAANFLEQPAFDVQQIKYDLTHRAGAATAVEYAVVARTDYDAATNCTGIHDGLLNTCPSNALGARSGGMQLTFADMVNKSDLTIVSVKLYFYVKINRTNLGGAVTVRHQWRKGTSGAWTVLATQTPAQNTTVDNLTTPIVYDITASISSWADIDAIEASIETELAANATGNNIQSIDAVELEVVATKTDTL